MKPRMVLPGMLWSVTCRTNDRRFFFIPEPKLKELFSYCLAYAQEKNPGVNVIAMQVMSNHYHLVVQDNLAQLPNFMQELNREIARAWNIEKRRRGSIWMREPNSWVQICTDKGLLEHINYILMNCVKAGLVEKSQDWEGFNILPSMMAKSHVFARPKLAYFSKRSAAPDFVRLEVGIPSSFSHLSPEKWRYMIEKRLKASEKAVKKERGLKGFLGMAKVKREPWGRFPHKAEAMRSTHPQFMGDDSPEGQRKRRLAREKYWEFTFHHELALYCKRNGLPYAFPPGTYRWFHVFRVEIGPLEKNGWDGNPRKPRGVRSNDKAYGAVIAG